MKRKTKQIIYLSIFILILILFLSFIFPKQNATCDDNIKNQSEEDIDCGGPCPPCGLKEKIVIDSLNYLFNKNNTLDIIAKIENKNEIYGLKNLKYQFLIYDVNNVLKDTIRGETIIFPSETRYILKLNYPVANFNVGRIEFKILKPKSIDWIKLSGSSIKISTYNNKLIIDNEKLKAVFSVYNNSPNYYKKLEVIVFVYDQNQNLLTVGRTETSLMPNESKDLVVFLGANITDKDELDLLKTEVIFQKLEE